MSPRGPRGELISDRYRIEDRLGSGGMSSVFRAQDTILERTVAVKILAEHLSDDERFVELQGTAEHKAFDRAQMNQMVDLASAGIKQLFALQRSAIDAPASE